MITFRTVLNFVHGNGLVFNLGDRVQGYTHPLWMLVLSLSYWINDEIFISTMYLGIVLTAIAFSIAVFKARQSILNLSIVCLGLISSKAFIEYGTSGLENPLSYVLFGLLFIMTSRNAIQKDKDQSSIAIIAICSLIFLCRMDYAVICAPIAIMTWIRLKKIKPIIMSFLIGGLPAFSWLIFSSIYYGTPFPNTYYAKLHTGIPKYQTIIQGIHYFQDLINHDLLSFAFILISLIALVLQKDKKAYAIAFGFGVFLYLLYILNIGGDFMSGRFFAVPVYLAALIFSSLNTQYQRSLIPIGILIVYLAAQNLLDLYKIPVPAMHANGIAHERGFYYEPYGLKSSLTTFPNTSQWKRHESAEIVPQSVRTICGGLGNESLREGADVHFVDQCGLVDALLVRLPTQKFGKETPDRLTVFSFLKLVYIALFESVPGSWTNEFGWRIGHLDRDIPKGYIESIQQGENRIENEAIATLYDDIKTVISDPIWSFERFKLIWLFSRNKL
jgi:arabinofuranosyltransferase